MESLNKTKESFISITKALAESQQIQKTLQEEYEKFEGISRFGSSLYFSCLKFGKNNPLYLLSVLAFIRLFLESLQTFQVYSNFIDIFMINFKFFQNLENNVDSQNKHLLSIVYRYMCRGIFESDRLKFSLHLTHELHPHEIPESEWNVFIGKHNIGKIDLEEVPPWIAKNCVTACQNLQVSKLN